MNRQEIITVLRELHKVSGFRISLHSADFGEIAAFPENRCLFCDLVNRNNEEHKMCVECDKHACHRAKEDGKTYIYKCRYGLTEAVSPLYNFGTLTGFLMMGQIAESESDKRRAEKGLGNLIFSREERLAAVETIPLVDPSMVQSYVRIMTICAEYLTLSNSVIGEKRTVAEEAVLFIEENLDKKFAIPDICRNIGCSKSTLLTTFKRKYGKTVNCFVTEQRLKKAVGLLYEGKKSVAEISSECGFSDQSYFSKVFSAKYGVPPSEYRSKKEEFL